MTAWALPDRPELVEAVIEQRPALVSLSFGPIRSRDVQRLHAGGVLVSAQVHSPQAACDAVSAGVDLIEAQGTEAGGHTGTVAMLPLLQRLQQETSTPLLAAGGIATPGALAAVLVAGAVGARVGTPLLLSQEAVVARAARDRLRSAEVDDTVLSSLFDRALRPGWPQEYPMRTLANALPARGARGPRTSCGIAAPCSSWPRRSPPTTSIRRRSWPARPSACSGQHARPLR